MTKLDTPQKIGSFFTAIGFAGILAAAALITLTACEETNEATDNTNEDNEDNEDNENNNEDNEDNENNIDTVCGDNLENATQPAGCTANWLTSVSGTVVDDNGEALEDALAQLCIRVNDGEGGTILKCLIPTNVNSEGGYCIVLAEADRCVEKASLHLLIDATNTSQVYCDLNITANEPNHTAGERPLQVLIPASIVPEIPDDDSEIITVAWADGLEMTFVENIFRRAWENLAAKRFSADNLGICDLPPLDNVTALYAFSPESNIRTLPDPLSTDLVDIKIPEAGLAEGSDVSLFILGGLGCELADRTPVEEAHWQEIGIFSVSDGFIEAQIPCINWLAYGPVD